MDKKLAGVLVVLVAAAALTGIALTRLHGDKVQLESRLGDLEHQLQVASETVMVQQKDLAQQTDTIAELKEKLTAIQNPPIDNPGCVDSDADHGEDQIYYTGAAHSGNSVVRDQCRLGQLVEFSCIENPAGSGILHADAKIMDCPQDSRCVDGACFR